MENITFEKTHKVATGRMLSAIGAYSIWKWTNDVININNTGGEGAANRAVGILNNYSAVFQQIKISTYKSFVADLWIFFDKKGYEESFSITKLLNSGKMTNLEKIEIKKQIEKIKKEHGINIKFLQELRNADVGHQEMEQKARHIVYVEVEKLFKGVQEILNLISNAHNRSVDWWNHIEPEINREMKWILDNLERGEVVRLKEIEEIYKVSLQDSTEK